MVGKVCSKCNVGWVIHLHEKYCGFCGCKVFDFSVKWKEEPWIYADDGGNIRQLTILVENTGAYPISFHPIRTTRENTIQFTDANDEPFKVEAGKSHPVEIRVDPAKLAQNPETITVRAQNAPPKSESEKLLCLEALPRPDFKITPDLVVVRYRKGTETVPEELHLEVLQSQFYINDIKATGDPVVRVGYSQQLHQKNGAIRKVLLKVDCNRLTDEPNEVKLNFELQDCSQPIEKRIMLQREIVPDPPKLQLSSTHLEMTQEREKTHTITYQNTGEQPLIIQNIEFNDPSNLLQLSNIEYPINIESGGHYNIDMLISADSLEPGDHQINFTINSNCVENPQYEGILNVRVNELEEYPHYLAIDFGTTNSCCAYIGTEGVPELIQLESGANPLYIMPSSIIYHSQPKNGDIYKVGYGAETDRTSEIDGPYYISSVKRWLGFNWNRQFPNSLKLQPSDVVADILKHIIKHAEKHLDTISTKSKIKKFVITYPTMFDRKQQTAIKQAFKKLEITEKLEITDIKLIDEASAASLGAISRQKKQGDYRLLVYDFGGGTIDIVLSNVTSDSKLIAIEPLAHGGNPSYGGDDVTQAIVDLVLDEFRERIQNVNLNLRYDIPYLSPRKIWQPSGDQKKDKATLLNTPFLYNNAEALKKELSDQIEANRNFPLNVLVGGDVQTLDSLTNGKINISISKEKLNSLVVDELRQTFVEIDTMISDNDGYLPEIVILAGQSSRMPIVKKMMADHFQTKHNTNIDIHLSESPKECVAIGAAQYGMTYSMPSKVWFDIKNFRKTHASIGIMQFDGIQQVFEEIIPKGRLIPDESFGSMEMPLRPGETNIDVRERFGQNGKLSHIDDYTLSPSENIPREILGKAKLKMSVEDSGEIKVIALVGGEEDIFTVIKKTPEFVNEI